jgi:FkbM family methyltransferase
MVSGKELRFKGTRVTIVAVFLLSFLSLFYNSGLLREQPRHAKLADLSCTFTHDHRTTQLVWKTVLNANNADFAALERLCTAFQASGISDERSIVLVGGTNAGQLSEKLLSLCPNLTFHGFEIQREYFMQASEALKMFPHAQMHNLGWSERAASTVPIGGSGKIAGLYNPEGQRGLNLTRETVSTVSLAAWIEAEGILQVTYAVIDTEGNEGRVLRGMRLENTQNRRAFPLFQFELGGTWARRDKRNGGDPWSQIDAAVYLEDLGYELFLVGNDNWLYVQSEFFEPKKNVAILDEGFGPFIQGNILAMHIDYTPRLLRAKILAKSSFILRRRC